MTDQTSEQGQDQHGAAQTQHAAAQTETSPLSTRSPPVIQGEAVEIPAEPQALLPATAPSPNAEAEPAPQAEHPVETARESEGLEPSHEPLESAAEHEVTTDKAEPPMESAADPEAAPEKAESAPETPDEAMESAAEPEAVAPTSPAKKNSFLTPVAGLVGLVLIGGAGYVSWQQYEAVYHKPPFQFGETAAPESASQSANSQAANPEAPPRVDAATNEAAPAENAAPVKKSDGAAPDAGKAEPAAAASVSPPASPSTASSASPAPEGAAPDAGKAEPASQASVSPAPDSAGREMANTPPAAAPDAPSAMERELIDKLNQTRAQIEVLQQRLATAEAKLAEPKAESRVLATPDAAPARSVDAATRLVLAQSLVSAVDQGVDFAPLIGVLEKFGADPQHVAQLRAGLAAPSPAKLATDFSALSSKIIAAAAPPSPKSSDAGASQTADTQKSFGEKALAFLQSRAEKIIKVRLAGSAQDQAAGHVAQAIKDLNVGDLAGAVAEQAQLPEAARAVTADWAGEAKTRLDAEAAAKAEVAAALQNLSNSKI